MRIDMQTPLMNSVPCSPAYADPDEPASQDTPGLSFIDPKTLKPRIPEGDAPALLHWGRKPVAVGEAGQGLHHGVIVSFQQIDTVAADQAVASPMRRLGM